MFNLQNIKDVHGDNISKSNFDLELLLNGVDMADAAMMNELTDWVISNGKKAKDWKAAKWRARVRSELSGIPQNCAEFVQLYAAKNIIVANYAGTMTRANITDYDLTKMARDMRRFSEEYGLRFTKLAIDDQLSAWIDDAKERRLNEWMEAVAYNADVETDWARFVGAVVDLTKVNEDYAIAAIKGVIWQIKRRLADDPQYPVHHHFMPVLSGGQGVGKGTFVKALMRGFEDMRTTISFSELTDERQVARFKMPLLYVEEMARAKHADIERVKQVITRDDFSFRPMGTNDSILTRQLSTMIGDCNGSLGSHFRDATGMRRFAPLYTGHEDNEANRAAGLRINDFRYLESLTRADVVRLWQAVDYKSEHPLLASESIKSEWKRLQEAERAQMPLEAWLREVGPNDSYETKSGDYHSLPAERGVRNREMFDCFFEWCKKSNENACSYKEFANHLKQYAREDWFPFTDSKKDREGYMVRRWKDEFIDYSASNVLAWRPR